MARRSSLRKTSDKTKNEQGKHSGKYALSGLLVCAECGSPYRRVTYMPRGKKRYVWRCINRLEHGKKICKCAPTLEEPDIHAAVTAAMTALLARKGELERERPADTGCGSRVRVITGTLEHTDSFIEEFEDGTVRQLVSSIRVLDRERLSTRFKDGTEIEQIIECMGRASA